MYACQVWGTRFMKKGSEFDSPLKTAHVCFLKGVLGVKITTPTWAVLRECGQEPLQFYWFRAAAKFLNSLLCGNSGLLKKIAHADTFQCFLQNALDCGVHRSVRGSGCVR